MKKLLQKKTVQAYLLAAPLLTGCGVFYLAPFIKVVQYAFTSAGRFDPGNFLRVAENRAFSLAFGNSMLFFGAGLPLILTLAYGVALLLKQQASRHKLLKSVFLLPYIMPVVGTVLLVELLFGGEGALSRFLSLSGSSAFWVTVLLYLWKNTGYGVILLLAGLVTIPEDQYESAQLDGATAFQKFRYITTPQMWRSVFFAVVFSVINGFKCFREIFLIGGEDPSDELYMLQHFVNNSFESLNFAKLSVSSVILLAVLAVLFGTFYAFVQRKERYRQ